MGGLSANPKSWTRGGTKGWAIAESGNLDKYGGRGRGSECRAPLIGRDWCEIASQEVGCGNVDGTE